MDWALGFLVLVTTLTAWFLGSELWKKFGFMDSFVKGSRQVVTYHYPGGYRPRMYKMHLLSHIPFKAIIGFELTIPFLGTRYDPFGYIQSHPWDDTGVYQAVGGPYPHQTVIELWLGKDPVTFHFLIDREVRSGKDIVISVTDLDVVPDAVFQPHFYQKRLGLFS